MSRAEAWAQVVQALNAAHAAREADAAVDQARRAAARPRLEVRETLRAELDDTGTVRVRGSALGDPGYWIAWTPEDALAIARWILATLED